MGKTIYEMIKGNLKIDNLGKTFYRGYSKTFAKKAIGSSLFYPIYDYSKTYFNNIFIASLVSAIISTIIMHPVDYLKTIHMCDNLKYSRNIFYYYNGLSLNLLRIVPHFTIMMCCIEYFKK